MFDFDYTDCPVECPYLEGGFCDLGLSGPTNWDCIQERKEREALGLSDATFEEMAKYYEDQKRYEKK